MPLVTLSSKCKEKENKVSIKMSGDRYNACSNHIVPAAGIMRDRSEKDLYINIYLYIYILSISDNAQRSLFLT